MYDVAVILPTIGRWTTLQAIESVYGQVDVGSIQLLVGIDALAHDFLRIDDLLQSPPPHVDVLILHPGYSTSVRHGGVHTSGSGGALRTMLSYLAHSRYLCYLDDDNWWAPHHLSELMRAVRGKHWAFSGRSFVHPEHDDFQCQDQWESVGLNKGVFAAKLGGWVDPNCLIIDKTLCGDALGLWSDALQINAQGWGLAADRRIFDCLRQKPHGETGSYTVYYRTRPEDPNHKNRIDRLRKLDEADFHRPKKHNKANAALVIVCKGRLQHLKRSLPLVARLNDLQVIVVDDDCPEHTGEWVAQNYPTVQVVRPANPRPFCLARARNLGAAAVTAPWIIFMDADVLVRPSFANWLTQPRDPGFFYCNSRDKPELYGSFLCSTRSFKAVGGYDENFRSWGGEDADIYFRLEQADYVKAAIPAHLWDPILHDDALRFTFAAGPASKGVSILQSHFYATIKYDLQALGFDFSKLPDSESVLQRINGAVVKAAARKEAQELSFSLGRRKKILMIQGFVVSRKISYQISRET